MRYTLSPKVKCDLQDIAEWIAQESPRRAVKVVRELRAEFERIAQEPLLYRLRPDVGQDARTAIAGRHVILFWVDGDRVRLSVWFMAVAICHRSFGYRSYMIPQEPRD